MATAREVILAVMGEVQSVAKKERNLQQNFNFRGIDAVVNKVGPALRNAGGFIVPEVVSQVHSTGATKSGGTTNIVRLEVKFSIFGADGEPIVGTVAAESFDSGDKATAKAMSVAFRTFLLQVLALPTDEPDPDATSYEAVVVKDWAKLAEDFSWKQDLPGLLNLYADAERNNAPAEVLTKIKELGSGLRQSTNPVG